MEGISIDDTQPKVPHKSRKRFVLEYRTKNVTFSISRREDEQQRVGWKNKKKIHMNTSVTTYQPKPTVFRMRHVMSV